MLTIPGLSRAIRRTFPLLAVPALMLALGLPTSATSNACVGNSTNSCMAGSPDKSDKSDNGICGLSTQACRD